MNQVDDDNHYGLDDIFNTPNPLSVLATPAILTPEQLAASVPPTAVEMRSTFCGLLPGRDLPQGVCLHREETQAEAARQAFDADSWLGFLHSLAACRDGLWHQPAPQARQNLTSDVHLQTPLFTAGEDPEQAPRATLALLRDVPHFQLGRLLGSDNITVHVLFPHLQRPRDRFVSLTREQHTRWLNQVFYPAVYECCEAHVTQHLPASFRHAYANSKARQVEDRKVETASYQAQQAISYHLQPEYLEPIWTMVLSLINSTPGLADFREPQLFFSAKGTKLQFKTNPTRSTLLHSIEHFLAFFERVFDLDFVDLERAFIDLATEICPHVHALPGQALRVDQEPQVYLWKRCCLEAIIKALYDGDAPAVDGAGQRYYTMNMLRDSACATSQPPKRSRLYQGGVRYLQLYSSVKEVWDANKSVPFANDGLEEMALDPQIRQAANHLAGGARRQAEVIERGYCTSKGRAHFALTDSQSKSFGIRGEVRITYFCLLGLRDRLRLQAPDQAAPEHHDCPPYAWAVRTEVYLNFLWRSLDKFASLFEIVRARAQRDLVTWEQTKVMAMALRCLRFVCGGHQLSRESALWWSRREREAGQPPRLRVWYGLGFCHTLRQYGYCWLEPRIDWDRLVFQPMIADNVLFGNSALRGQYLRRGGRVSDFLGTTRKVDLALEWLRLHHGRQDVRNRLIWWMVHVCLLQFRQDVLASISAEIQPERRDDALDGMTTWSKESLDGILLNETYLISGNKSDFKVPSHLARFLFDYDDGRIRNHWDRKPYRALYRRIRTALSTQFAQELGLLSTFSRRFWRTLFAHHWILPYPSPEVLTQTTKQGVRMLYSIKPDPQLRGQPVERLEPADWHWARKDWRVGVPPPVPADLAWTQEQWQDWIDRQLVQP